MSALVMAGIDHRAYLRTTDPLERMVDRAVADRVLDERVKYDEQLARETGAETGNRVGRIVGRALGEALQSISRAMSRR